MKGIDRDIAGCIGGPGIDVLHAGVWAECPVEVEGAGGVGEPA